MNMKIQSLTQKKYSNKCYLVTDDGEVTEISLDLVMKYSLKKGIEISDDLLKDIYKQQRIFDIKQAALSYASFKPRTTRQVIEKLKQKGFDKEETGIALKFLSDFDLLDDEKFARLFVNDYLKKKSVGKQKIFFELLKKGIDKSIASEAIERNFPEENKFEIALKAAEKKLRMLSGKPADKIKNSLYGFLLRQGFENAVIKQVLSDLLKK